MGGYAGKAVAVDLGDADLDVYVWHDGEFPFSDDDARFLGDEEKPKTPVKVHHCDVGQFRLFADQVETWLSGR
jgi:hypothetical protein